MSGLHPRSIEAVPALAAVMFLPRLQMYLLLSFPIITVTAILLGSRHTNPCSPSQNDSTF